MKIRKIIITAIVSISASWASAQNALLINEYVKAGVNATTGGAIRLSSSDNSLRLDFTTAAGLANVLTASNTPLVFGTNGTERVRIGTTGRQIWANYTAIDSFTYSNIQGNIGFTSSGQIITTPTSFFHINFSSTNVTLTSMASGLQFFSNNNGYIHR